MKMMKKYEVFPKILHESNTYVINTFYYNKRQQQY